MDDVSAEQLKKSRKRGVYFFGLLFCVSLALQLYGVLVKHDPFDVEMQVLVAGLVLYCFWYKK